jgi:hypothetical protein
MATHSQVIDDLTRLTAAMRAGLQRAGFAEDGAEEAFGTIAGGYRSLLEDAIFLAGIELRKEKEEIVDYIAIEGTRGFLVRAYIELEVDYGVGLGSIAHSGRLYDDNWKYVSTLPPEVVRRVKLAIGYLNWPWRGRVLHKLLKKSDSPLLGSGAWVREAFMAAPDTKNHLQGRICFPDSQTSHWQSLRDGDLHFPSVLLNCQTHPWVMTSSKVVQDPSSLLALIVPDKHTIPA